MAIGHPKLVPIILEHTRKEIDTEAPYQVIRGSYRASEVGDCVRYQGYKQLGYKREKINPELMFLFRFGHVVEREAIGYLRRSGFIVTNEQHVSLKTFEVPLTDKGHEEWIKINVTASLDLLLDGKYIVDVKSTNFFTAKYLSKPYIKKKYISYYDQLQTYLNLFEHKGVSEWGALFFIEKMTSKMMEFWFQKDEDYFHNTVLPKLARIERAVSQKKLPARPKGFTSSTQDCERCSMRIHCWGKKMKVRTWE